MTKLDTLEELILKKTHQAKQLADAIDVELNADKRQTLICSLAELQSEIWFAGDLLNQMENINAI